MSTELSIRMRNLADADGLPADHKLRMMADKFDSATDGFFAEPQTCGVAMYMKTWAQARHVWCQYSGEALI